MKNILFIVLGVLAFIVSMNRHINRVEPMAYAFQFYAATMIVIGGCGVAEQRKAEKKENKNE